MSDRKKDELTQLVTELIQTSNQALTQHAGALARINANLEASHKTASNHAEAIQAIRQDQLGLVELVNTQSRVVSALQSCMLKVLDHLGLAQDGSPAATVN